MARKYPETRPFGTVIERWRIEQDGSAPTRLRFTFTAAVNTPPIHQRAGAGPMWMVERYDPEHEQWWGQGWRYLTQVPPDDARVLEAEWLVSSERLALGYTLDRLGDAIESTQRKLDGMRRRFNAMFERKAELDAEEGDDDATG